jgi:uncharacterized membrane protein
MPASIAEPPVRSDIAPPSTSGPIAIAARLDSVDLLRGIIMVIMSLDHIREYLTWVPFAPENLARTWPALFFTRWITHFCAPLFFFLAGTGAWLAASRGRSGSQLSHFLWTRGLWLVIVEFTIVDFAFTFAPGFIIGSVIVALGLCMIILAGVVRMPLRFVAAFGVGMIFLHNLLDRIQPQQFGKLAWLWTLLHAPGLIPIAPQRGMYLALYVLIPWMGVMAAGYAFGALYSMDTDRRRRWMIAIGTAAVVLFVVLRATNIYGNPPQGPFPGTGPFKPQSTAIMTLVAFLNAAKYPPSLQFLLMTLGPGILALAAFERVRTATSAAARALVVFGRVPLFYFVLHILTAHVLAIGFGLIYHQPITRLLSQRYVLTPPEVGYGHGLPFIYAVWIAMNVALYFPCRWYAEYKRAHRKWWLSYL